MKLGTLVVGLALAASSVPALAGGRRQVVVLEIDVPRGWLKRHGGGAKALWYSVRDIGPEHIRGVITFGEVSRSPAAEAVAR